MDTVGPRAPFTLDEQLCFALHSASRAMTGCYRPLLDTLGLTYSQYALLLVLWENGAVTQGDLGDRLFLDSGTLSPLLRRLETRGLVARHRRPEDERTVEVSVTAEGAALRDRAAAVQSRVQDATGLTADELARMRDDLHLLAARLRRAETGPLPVEEGPDVA
ncbi:MarR family transcriptional regulator [Pseudonocardia sediminis]|uniref:MarR family transcriptional regulator n=1 Tax=Pseudonocardia sediminis TaxID=1397368 RepID=A0A4Q7V222_PSEST|nr:MarR family transcriptional regulator [Pseudonocardia sediminis]RZT86619.1 MarR family transcriptional regulator [Pseudonocardia sediminis]